MTHTVVRVHNTLSEYNLYLVRPLFEHIQYNRHLKPAHDVCAVPGEVIRGRDVGFSVVLSGGGVRFFFQTLPARAHELPVRNATPGRAGQDLCRLTPSRFQAVSLSPTTK